MNKYQREYLNAWTKDDKATYRCSSPTCRAEFRDVNTDNDGLRKCPYCGARLLREYRGERMTEEQLIRARGNYREVSVALGDLADVYFHDQCPSNPERIMQVILERMRSILADLLEIPEEDR